MKDATPKEMAEAVKRLHRSGRGVYGMKALASGQVTGQAEVAGRPYTDAVGVG
jgi:hypothetical protein